MDKVRELLIQGRYVDCRDPRTWKTPLHYACGKGHVAVVRVLLMAKASLSRLDRGGCYPLHCACVGGNYSVVRVLVSEFKADLTILTSSLGDAGNRTVLMLAARGGHYDLVLDLLHDYHCPVTDTDSDGWGVLHHACAGGSVNIVQILIHDCKADVIACNKLLDSCG